MYIDTVHSNNEPDFLPLFPSRPADLHSALHLLMLAITTQRDRLYRI